MKMSMEHWWNDIDRGKQKYLEIKPFQCPSANHKSQTEWPVVETWPPRREADD